jgi:hypothetical protein
MYINKALRVNLPKGQVENFTIDLPQFESNLHLWVAMKGVVLKILKSDIILIKADGNYSIIHLESGKKVLTSKT